MLFDVTAHAFPPGVVFRPVAGSLAAAVNDHREIGKEKRRTETAVMTRKRPDESSLGLGCILPA